jgi:hypothetical protein
MKGVRRTWDIIVDISAQIERHNSKQANYPYVVSLCDTKRYLVTPLHAVALYSEVCASHQYV